MKKNAIKNVFFKGYVKNIVELRKNMDIALICSNMEAFGRVTIEAMYYENFVIGSDSGATKELIQGKYGKLYEKCNFKDLAKKITESVNDINQTVITMKKSKEYALDKFNRNIFNEINLFYKEIWKENANNERDKI